MRLIAKFMDCVFRPTTFGSKFLPLYPSTNAALFEMIMTFLMLNVRIHYTATVFSLRCF